MNNNILVEHIFMLYIGWKQDNIIRNLVSDSKKHAQAIFDIAYALSKNRNVEEEVDLIQGKYIRVQQYKLTKEVRKE